MEAWGGREAEATEREGKEGGGVGILPQLCEEGRKEREGRARESSTTNSDVARSRGQGFKCCVREPRGPGPGSTPITDKRRGSQVARNRGGRILPAGRAAPLMGGGHQGRN